MFSFQLTLSPLSQNSQLAVGTMGLPCLAAVLRDDRDDIELVRGALECLVLAVGQPASGDLSGGGGSAAEVSVGFSR